MEQYALNIENIAKSKEFPAVLTQLAAKVQAEQYLDPGKFFKELNIFDLRMLNEMVTVSVQHVPTPNMDTDADLCVKTVMLLGVVLATGEGVVDFTSMDVLDRVYGATTIFITAEVLARKGFAEITYENVTYEQGLGDAMKPFAKATQQARDAFGNQFGDDAETA